MLLPRFKLKDIRSAVRLRLDDDGIEDATIDMCANEAQYELLSDKKIRFMEATEPIALAEGEYSIEMPKLVREIYRVSVTDDATNKITPITDNESDADSFWDNFPSYETAPAKAPSEWTIDGDYILFSAPADKDYTVTIKYLRYPSTMVRENDYCEMPLYDKELMILSTMRRIMRMNEDYEEGDEEQKKIDRLFRIFLANNAKGSGSSKVKVIKSNRRRSRQGYWSSF